MVKAQISVETLQTYGLVLLGLTALIGLLYFMFKPPAFQDQCFVLPHLECRVYPSSNWHLKLTNKMEFPVYVDEIQMPGSTISVGQQIDSGDYIDVDLGISTNQNIDAVINTTYHVPDSSGEEGWYEGFVRANAVQ